MTTGFLIALFFMIPIIPVLLSILPGVPGHDTHHLADETAGCS